MEHIHTESEDTRAVLGRFLRRKMKLPLKVAGCGAAAALLMGAVMPHHKKTPDFNAKASITETPTAGTIQSLYARSVGAPYSGSLLNLTVRPGQVVHQGDPLFQMDTSSLKDQLAQARANRASAAAEYAQARRNAAGEERNLLASMAAVRSQLRAEQAAGAVQPASPPSPDSDEGTGDGLPVESPAPAAPGGDPARVQELQERLSALHAELADRNREWRPALRQAAEQTARAQQEVRRLEQMVSGSGGRSPADGVVTALYAQPGFTVNRGQPLVRIDNPAGYRIVAQIDRQAREAVEPGTDLRIALPTGPTTGKVEKIVSGTDKALFTYQVWVKPEGRAILQPGAPVKVFVPRRDDASASAK